MAERVQIGPGEDAGVMEVVEGDAIVLMMDMATASEPLPALLHIRDVLTTGID